MKRIKFWMLAAILVCGTTSLLTACSSSDDDNPVTPVTPQTPTDNTPQAKADYTILYYAQGGGDLDINIITNMSQFYEGLKAISANKVNVAVQYKASTYENLKKTFSQIPTLSAADVELTSKGYGSTTFRMLLDPTYKDFEAQVYAMQSKAVLGRQNGNADITTPDSLANFIKWAAKTAPADKYILVMSSHGGGYLPQDDFMQPTATRGIIYDDGFDGHFFGLPDITQALQTSGQHMTAIYLDACLMNTLEYQFELQPLTDYLILSSFSVPALGGQYGALVQQLGTKSLETALSEYVKNTVSFWDANGGPTPHHDMTVTRTSGLAAFGTKMKEFTDKLTDAYKNGGSEVKTAIDAATKGAFKIEKQRPLYDIYDYYHAVGLAAPAYISSSLVNDLDNALNSAIVYQQCSNYLIKQGYKVEATVLMGAQNHYTLYAWQRDKEGQWNLPEEGILHYEADGTLKYINPTTGNTIKTEKWQSDFDHSYKMTKFDKATGWSRWMEVNEQEPNERCAADWGI